LRDPSRLRRGRFATNSGTGVPDLATPSDLAANDQRRAIVWPGECPFVRGIHPTMYRGRLWTAGQDAGYASAARVNAWRVCPRAAGGAGGRRQPQT
jgi:methylmalonyl-CoA mutase, N-terminal domain